MKNHYYYIALFIVFIYKFIVFVKNRYILKCKSIYALPHGLGVRKLRLEIARFLATCKTSSNRILVCVSIKSIKFKKLMYCRHEIKII